MPPEWQLIDDALQLVYDAGRGCHLVKMDVKSAAFLDLAPYEETK